jgi:hypothetical protein
MQIKGAKGFHKVFILDLQGKLLGEADINNHEFIWNPSPGTLQKVKNNLGLIQFVGKKSQNTIKIVF